MWRLLGNLSMSFAQLRCGFSVQFSDWFYLDFAKSEDFILQIFYWIPGSGWTIQEYKLNVSKPLLRGYQCILGHCLVDWQKYFFYFCFYFLIELFRRTCSCCAASCNLDKELKFKIIRPQRFILKGFRFCQLTSNKLQAWFNRFCSLKWFSFSCSLKWTECVRLVFPTLLFSCTI